jgi:hypothetical protein
MADDEPSLHHLWRAAMGPFEEFLGQIHVNAATVQSVHDEVKKVYTDEVHALMKGACSDLLQLLRPLMYPDQLTHKRMKVVLPLPSTLQQAVLSTVQHWVVPFEEFATRMRTLYHASARAFSQLWKFNLLRQKQWLPVRPGKLFEAATAAADLPGGTGMHNAWYGLNNILQRHKAMHQAMTKEASNLAEHMRTHGARPDHVEAVDAWVASTRALTAEAESTLQKAVQECKCGDAEGSLQHIAPACVVKVVPKPLCKPPCAALTAADLRAVCPTVLKAAKAEWKVEVSGGARRRAKVQAPGARKRTARQGRRKSSNTRLVGGPRPRRTKGASKKPVRTTRRTTHMRRRMR